MVWGGALAGAREECQVPVLGDVPVERVEGVEQDGEEPEAVEGGGAHGDAGVVEAEAALEGAENDDGEGGGVFEGVGEVLAAPIF